MTYKKIGVGRVGWYVIVGGCREGWLGFVGMQLFEARTWHKAPLLWAQGLWARKNPLTHDCSGPWGVMG